MSRELWEKNRGAKAILKETAIVFFAGTKIMGVI